MKANLEKSNESSENPDRAPTMKFIQKSKNTVEENKDSLEVIDYINIQHDQSYPAEEHDQSDSELDQDHILIEVVEYINSRFQANNWQINIPSFKKQKAFYEAYKECKFKPELNKKSLQMASKKPKETKEFDYRKDVGTIVKQNNNQMVNIFALSLVLV